MLSRAIEELALSVPEAAPLARRMLRVVGPARILSVAERFEALTAGRSSARATPQAALEQVVAGSGSEFDPAIVEGLRRAVHEGNFELNLPAVALPAAAVATA